MTLKTPIIRERFRPWGCKHVCINVCMYGRSQLVNIDCELKRLAKSILAYFQGGLTYDFSARLCGSNERCSNKIGDSR